MALVFVRVIVSVLLLGLAAWLVPWSLDQRLVRYKPDLVVVDINLPGMDGIQAVKKMKKKAPDSVFVSASVNKDKQTIVQAIKAGASDYLVKPVQWDQIENRIVALFQEEPGNSDSPNKH